jgi:hypothetical protein
MYALSRDARDDGDRAQAPMMSSGGYGGRGGARGGRGGGPRKTGGGGGGHRRHDAPDMSYDPAAAQYYEAQQYAYQYPMGGMYYPPATGHVTAEGPGAAAPPPVPPVRW